MKLHKLFKESCFECRSQTDGFVPDVSTKAYFMSLHSSQWIGDSISIILYKITYSYLTARHNPSIGNKFFIKSEGFDNEEAIEYLADMHINDWVQAHNKKYPYKKISNVKILDILPESKLVLPLQF